MLNDGVKFHYNFNNNGQQTNFNNDNLFSRVYTSPFHAINIRDEIREELEKKKYGFNKYPVKRGSKEVPYSRIQRSRLYDKVAPHMILI